MKKSIELFFVTLLFCSFLFAQESKPLKIIEKPKPSYPEGIGCVQGVVRLRVRFLESGKIGEIKPVSELGFGLTESAIEAAKKIKFNPALNNGVPISTAKVIEFNFSYDYDEKADKAEAVLAKAVQKLGGEKYLQVKTIVGSGNFSVFRDGSAQITQTFVDVIVFPDKERTEFKTGGTKTIQTNFGDKGWIADTSSRIIKEQNPEQIEGFKRGIRTSLDNLLRAERRKEKAVLSYVGRREASLGKRNDVVKLTYEDGFEVEFEFAADGLPMKSIYKQTRDGAEIKEEDRYAQFVDVQGIFAPFVVDHFQNGVQTSRINYLRIEYNKSVSESIFNQPKDPKELKKDLKL